MYYTIGENVFVGYNFRVGIGEFFQTNFSFTQKKVDKEPKQFLT